MGEHVPGLARLQEKTNEELLAMYRDTKEPEIKRELTLRYLYIVKAIASQMRSVYTGSLQTEDIINEGVIAIMKGLDRYEPDRNYKFETFISRRIRGMIIDLVRKNDWMPRDFRKQSKAIEDARLSLSLSLGRKPTDEEVAREVNLDVKKLQKIQGASTVMNLLSLDMALDDDERQAIQLQCLDDNLQPENAFIAEETRRALAEGVETLKEKEKMVISLYYVEELNMGQISKILEVSEPRVSQLHSAAIQKLKDYMNKYIKG